MRRWILICLALIACIPVGLGVLYVGYGLINGHDVMAGLGRLIEPGLQPVVSNPTLQKVTPRSVRWLGDIEHRDLRESSGLTTSNLHDGVLWSINDSGGAATLFAMDKDGTDRGAHAVALDKPGDWEAMDSFMLNGQSYIAVGDVGDNLRWRRKVSINIIAEPAMLEDVHVVAEVAWSITFTFPDGAHDCEALAVDADAGYIYLLSKRETPSVLYRVPLQPAEDVVAEYVGALSQMPRPTLQDEIETLFWQWRHTPTGMDLHADQLLVTTYQHAYVFSMQDLAAAPKQVDLPSVALREAISFDRDNTDVAFVSREREDGTGVADIYEIRLAPHACEQTLAAAAACVE